MVYFIRCNDFVKIGYTSGPVSDRLSALQTGNPVELSILAAIPGEPRDEQDLHAKFAASRVRGEWFVLSSDLYEYIYRQQDWPNEGIMIAFIESARERMEIGIEPPERHQWAA